MSAIQTKSPLSAIQRRNMSELAQRIYHLTEGASVERLDRIFMESFKHPMNEASYEEGARITAQLLASQRTGNADQPLARPSTVCPECGETAPAHAQTCTIGNPKPPPATQPAHTEAKAQEVVTNSDFPESPYSWNLHAEASDGWDEQFTIRASDSETFIKKIEGIKHYLSAKGYKPAQRGARPQATSATNGETAPNCAIHKVPMVKRNKDGRSWWSCTEKLDDGQWCQYRPKQA